MITTVALTAFLTSLATKGLDKFVDKGTDQVSEKSIEWLKSLFFKEGKPKKALVDIKNNPNDESKIIIAKGIIDNSIEDNPEYKYYLEELINKTQIVNNTLNNSNSKNVNTGNINTGGGDLQIGDRYEN